MQPHDSHLILILEQTNKQLLDIANTLCEMIKVGIAPPTTHPIWVVIAHEKDILQLDLKKNISTYFFKGLVIALAESSHILFRYFSRV